MAQTQAATGGMIRRWRNSRGFGVHSPAAYAIMREVIRPGSSYGLYAYHQLDCALERSALSPSEALRTRRVMRTLLRLCVHLSPKSLTLSGLPGLGALLPRLSGVRQSEPKAAEHPALHILGSETLPANLVSSIVPGDCVALVGPAVRYSDTIYNPLSGGIRIENPELTIILSLHDSAKPTYSAFLYD